MSNLGGYLKEKVVLDVASLVAIGSHDSLVMRVALSRLGAKSCLRGRT